MILTMREIEEAIRMLLRKYNADYAVLFGSYARGEADEESDIDVMVVGGEKFYLTNILGFEEELHEFFQKPVNVFEIREIKKDTEFYNNILREGVRIA